MMNYDKEMTKLIENLDHVPTLLLHSCCAPCSSAVIDRLKDYFDITILYYNPNIEPFEEYEKRKEEQKRFLKEIQSNNVISFLDCDYNNERFKALSKGHENDEEKGPRCYLCYEERIKYTKNIAKEHGFEYFGTTLSVSPYKISRWINEIGLNLEDDEVKFLVGDFKKQNGYKKSIEFSKTYGLYRQDYCGCIFSKAKKMTE